jgi:DNA-binding transcriptional ArsR family regulator
MMREERTSMANSKIEAPFAFEGLDRVFHEKARLGILTSLASHPDGIAFGQLRQLCGLTDGNLSRHIQVLEEARLVELHKGYEGKRPLTTCRLTEHGRAGFLNYLSVLEGVLRDAANATAPKTASAKSKTKNLKNHRFGGDTLKPKPA